MTVGLVTTRKKKSSRRQSEELREALRKIRALCVYQKPLTRKRV